MRLQLGGFKDFCITPVSACEICVLQHWLHVWQFHIERGCENMVWGAMWMLWMLELCTLYEYDMDLLVSRRLWDDWFTISMVSLTFAGWWYSCMVIYSVYAGIGPFDPEGMDWMWGIWISITGKWLNAILGFVVKARDLAFKVLMLLSIVWEPFECVLDDLNLGSCCIVAC